MKNWLIGIIGLASLGLSGQSYTSYFTGSATDAQVTPTGGVCLMGGAEEHDNAMRWFLQRASGGDVLVLRASGSNGYNSYLYSELGETVNSVETIVFNSADAAMEAYVQGRIAKAEAIWLAGGDQWNYVSYWRDSPIADLINEAVTQRNIVIGGTSAGMAILGGVYFTAENGTVTSAAALQNPYDEQVTLSNAPFLDAPWLERVITDTHYDNPDRRGRHMAFLAKAMTDYGQPYFGIACEEYTAVCIDQSGEARVFGDYPDYDDNVYFLTPNCALTDGDPETCSPGQALTWDRGGAALKVYKLRGTPTGLFSFDLSSWQIGTGGDWEDWSVDNAMLATGPGAEPTCSPVATREPAEPDQLRLYPNPVARDVVWVETPAARGRLQIWSLDGQLLTSRRVRDPLSQVSTAALAPGIYLVQHRTAHHLRTRRLVVVQ